MIPLLSVVVGTARPRDVTSLNTNYSNYRDTCGNRPVIVGGQCQAGAIGWRAVSHSLCTIRIIAIKSGTGPHEINLAGRSTVGTLGTHPILRSS